MLVYLITKHVSDYSESSEDIVGVYTDKEAVEAFVKEYNARLTYNEFIRKKTEEFMAECEVNIEPCPVFEGKKPIFDQSYKHDDIYKECHKLKTKEYKRQYNIFENTVVQAWHRKKADLIRDAGYEYRSTLFSSLDNDESFKNNNVRSENEYMEFAEFELQLQPNGNLQ